MQVEATARLKYVSIPPRKMRLVAEMVKNMPVEEALNVLNFTPKIAARHVARTLKSAAANALSKEGTDHLRPESLTIKSITVDAAPTAKRIRFESMGRVYRVRKRHCHLTIIVAGQTDVEAEAKKSRKKTRAAEVETEEAAAKKKTTRKKTAKKVTTKTATKADEETAQAETAAQDAEVEATAEATADTAPEATEPDEDKK